MESLNDASEIPDVEQAVESSEINPTKIAPHATQVSFSDLSGLPADLLKELGTTETLQKDQQILEVIKKSGGTATLSEILVGLYRIYGLVEKRRLLNSRLYNMVERRGLLKGVPGKKGVYTLP